MAQVPVNHFDRGKPFYPLVTHYVAQLAGFKELAVRGIVGAEPLDSMVTRSTALRGNREATERLRKAAGPLDLRCECNGQHIRVDVDEISRELAGNFGYLASWVMRSAGILLIVAHEISRPWRDAGPLWEFLRHCRNAAAHGGKFNFAKGEPRRPAIWVGIAVNAALQGTSLFKDDAGAGLLSPGDPVRLLWDIEQACPQMRA